LINIFKVIPYHIDVFAPNWQVLKISLRHKSGPFNRDNSRTAISTF